jgi:hypothetical protein
MDLGGQSIVEWFLCQVENDFPTGFDYRSNYATLAANLVGLYREVTPTANLIDGGYPPSHDVEHNIGVRSDFILCMRITTKAQKIH